MVPPLARPSRLGRRLVSASVLLLSVAVMLPWLAINAVVSAVVIAAAASGTGPRALLQAVDYAGEVAFGR